MKAHSQQQATHSVWRALPHTLRGHRSGAGARGILLQTNIKSKIILRTVINIPDSSSCDILHFGPADVTSCQRKRARGCGRGVPNVPSSQGHAEVQHPARTLFSKNKKGQLSSHLTHPSDVPYFNIYRPSTTPPSPPPLPHVMRWVHFLDAYATKTHHHHTVCATMCRLHHSW